MIHRQIFNEKIHFSIAWIDTYEKNAAVVYGFGQEELSCYRLLPL